MELIEDCSFFGLSSVGCCCCCFFLLRSLGLTSFVLCHARKNARRNTHTHWHRHRLQHFELLCMRVARRTISPPPHTKRKYSQTVKKYFIFPFNAIRMEFVAQNFHIYISIFQIICVCAVRASFFSALSFYLVCCGFSAIYSLRSFAFRTRQIFQLSLLRFCLPFFLKRHFTVRSKENRVRAERIQRMAHELIQQTNEMNEWNKDKKRIHATNDASADERVRATQRKRVREQGTQNK